ncbi:LuxR C-terminal-related transcriptional regulator [Streptomyces sp. NPDC089424]|uniref:LuxR C-terminal-related transcriptional regulator n=1 Tax=Streptomyces sp. NPDC089424 TaxID=3365917 RepID=UPI0038137199
MVSVLVVSDDQSLQRHALRLLLAAEPDLHVLGETSGGEAVRASAALRPDVVLLDSELSEATGTEVVQRIARLPDPAPRVLALAPANDEGQAAATVRAGATGFLLKDATPGELTAAIRVVASGDAVLTPALTHALIEAVRRQDAVNAPPPGPGPLLLTQRERDVLVAVASGSTNAEIAARLSIATTTVKSHVSHILTKIGARARVQAVTFAYETGLVRPAA